MNKRLISMLLVIVMIITLLPMTVLAASNVPVRKSSDESSTVNAADNTETSDASEESNDSAEVYKVTVVNDCELVGEDVEYTKFLLKHSDKEETVSLAPGESSYFEVQDGESYEVRYQGTGSRFRSSYEGLLFQCGDTEKSSNDTYWSHTMGAGFVAGHETVYYSESKPDEYVDEAAYEKDSNGNVIKNDTKKKYRISSKRSGLFNANITYTLTNVEDSTETYTGDTLLALTSASKAKNSAINKMKAAFEKEYPQYSGYESGDYYYIAEKLSSKQLDIIEECPADNVTLTFKSKVEPIKGNVKVNIYGPGFNSVTETGYLDDVDWSFSILNMSGDSQRIMREVGAGLVRMVGDISEPTPEVTLRLVEKEGQEGYAAREYQLEETEGGAGASFLEGIASLAGDNLDVDASTISRTYILPEDILIGDYTLVVDKIDQAGVVLAEGKEIPVSVTEGTTEIGHEKTIVKLPDSVTNSLIGSVIAGAINMVAKVKGLFLKHQGSFEFTKVDAADHPLKDAEFLLVNRDETKKIIDYVYKLGKENFEQIVKNFQNEDVFSWEEVVTLHTQLLKQDEENNLSIDPQTVTKLVGIYLAVLMTDTKWIDMEGLKELHIPAVLKSVSTDSGRVLWDKSKNVTLSILITTLSKVLGYVSDEVFNTAVDNEAFKGLYDTLKPYLNGATESAAVLADTVVYNVLWRMGIVTDRLPAGHYILFESKAPSGHLRNPMFYTVIVNWSDDEWVYASVADAGLILPYFAEQYVDFYEYLRKNNLSDNADKLIYNMLKPFVYNEDDLSKYENVYSDIVNDKVDASAYMIKFISAELWYYYGGKIPYESEEALQEAMIQYLYNQGRTVQNLMIFAHDIAKRSKGVITGEMNEDWHVFNLEASIFKTWQKSTKGILDRLSDSLAVGEISLTNEDGTVSKFKDLNPARWYYTAVKWVLENGIMAGVTTTDFRTATPVTRGMAVTVLYAAADYPKYENNSPFPDVSKLRYFYNAVGWAYENGIVDGYPDGTFKPDRTLTRQELVQMLKKYCEVMDLDINDVDTGNQIGLDQKVDFGNVAGWAKNAMEWAFKVGAIFGLTEDTIDPLDIVTRAQMAQIVYKILTYEAPATASSDTPVDVPADAPDDTAPADNSDNLPVGA